MRGIQFPKEKRNQQTVERQRIVVNDSKQQDKEGIIEYSFTDSILQAGADKEIQAFIESSDKLAQVENQLENIQQSASAWVGNKPLRVVHNTLKRDIRLLENSIEREELDAKDALVANQFLTETIDETAP